MVCARITAVSMPTTQHQVINGVFIIVSLIFFAKELLMCGSEPCFPLIFSIVVIIEIGLAFCLGQPSSFRDFEAVLFRVKDIRS